MLNDNSITFVTICVNTQKYRQPVANAFLIRHFIKLQCLAISNIFSDEINATQW